MTHEEAPHLARTTAEKEGWVWLEPVTTRASRRFLFFGKRSWHVYTNADCIGCNIRIGIDDETGKILYKGFAPR